MADANTTIPQTPPMKRWQKDLKQGFKAFKKSMSLDKLKRTENKENAAPASNSIPSLPRVIPPETIKDGSNLPRAVGDDGSSTPNKNTAAGLHQQKPPQPPLIKTQTPSPKLEAPTEQLQPVTPIKVTPLSPSPSKRQKVVAFDEEPATDACSAEAQAGTPDGKGPAASGKGGIGVRAATRAAGAAIALVVVRSCIKAARA